eukprot:TRINITY_DN19262_c0_g1_i1.p1 TRINITY_DN19262_c0_g1~~TRINITY_DN19262_c0_g1_i1.p1  ORF type:complete len:199 (+),score=12.17 TRINITY_DN19262_c0_g1_i1:2-598(+)
MKRVVTRLIEGGGRWQRATSSVRGTGVCISFDISVGKRINGFGIYKQIRKYGSKNQRQPKIGVSKGKSKDVTSQVGVSQPQQVKVQTSNWSQEAMGSIQRSGLVVWYWFKLHLVRKMWLIPILAVIAIMYFSYTERSKIVYQPRNKPGNSGLAAIPQLPNKNRVVSEDQESSRRVRVEYMGLKISGKQETVKSDLVFQ